MQLERVPTTLSAQEFVNRWRGTQLKERSASQSHFNDLCRVLGWPAPTDVDHAGEWYTFERGVDKLTAKGGWADVWLKDHFGWEYKGPKKDLAAAYNQLLQYKDSLGHPPLLVVSDLDAIIVHPQFTMRENAPIRFELDDLLDNEKRELLSQIFSKPETFRSERTTEEVTRAAATEFAALAERLRDRGEDPAIAAHFLIRLLFCLFAEDVQLLPEGLFARLVGQAKKHPAMSKQALAGLFGAMRSGGFFGADAIRHFNGGLFDDDTALELDRDDLSILDRVAALDWSYIEPAIFGTLFERSLDPSKRSQLGAHYTSKEDILLIVEPVLMAPLRRRWDEVSAEVDGLAEKRDATSDRGARTRRESEMAEVLRSFADEIADVKVLDPACGSGNFLYVALRSLLDLQKEVITRAGKVGLPMFFPTVDPSQLRGIEVNEYAHELAQVTIWIGYIQWMRESGFGSRSDPILASSDIVENRDAILAITDSGDPVEPVWPDSTVIIGNPPFLGGSKIRGELGDSYYENLVALYGDRLPGFSDLVCYWFEKARAGLVNGAHKRVGLLATQGIRGGSNRRVLDRISDTASIFWAESDRKWTLDGAVVHVSMVGFDLGDTETRSLDGSTVEHINPDLTAAVDVTSARRLAENQGLSFQGASPKGKFDVDRAFARELLNARGNVNGKPNSDVVRPVASGIDLVRRSRGKFTIDFGMMPLDKACEYEAPFEYVQKTVYPIRKGNRRDSYAKHWWQYAESRPAMRAALGSHDRFIATPRIAKHRLFVWLPRQVLPNDQIIVVARSDDYAIGVLQSTIHELWARRLGTQLREASSGARYTPNSTFETFPFPWPPGTEPTDSPDVQAISDAARELVEKRDRWLNPEGTSEAELKSRTLTNLYNQRPTWLELAHRKLDEAVLDAYGWSNDSGDEEILERLLALNLKRAFQSE